MPRIAFTHIDNVDWISVMPQLHGEREASIHLKTLERSDARSITYTRYDPGYVVDRHTHGGDELIFILEGDVTMGDTHCSSGTCIVLEKDTPIGPIVAGENGTKLLEIFIGKDAGFPRSVDPEESKRLFDSKGIKLQFDPTTLAPR